VREITHARRSRRPWVVRGHQTFRSLSRHRNYRLLYAGQLIAAIGQNMADVALPWLVLEQTNSPAAVGTLVFFRFAPSLIVGLFAGLAIDRVDARNCLVLTQGVTFCAIGGLAIMSLAGSLQLWQAYGLAAVVGLAQVFDVPARLTLVYELVGRADLQNAVALNASLYNFARIAGPALAGIVIAAFGPGWCFVLGAASTLAMLVALVLVRVEDLIARARGLAGQTLLQGLGEGFAYVRSSPQSRIVLGLTVAMGLGGFNPLVIVPLLASSLDTGPQAFGLLFACFGTGAVAGGLLSATLGRTTWRTHLTGAAGIGVGLLALAPTRSVAVDGLLLLLIGASFTVWAANSQTILQLAAPDRLRGRIVGFYVFAVLGVQPIGGLLAGWLTAHGGTLLAFAVMGGTTLAAVVVAAAAAQGTPAVVDHYAPIADPVPPTQIALPRDEVPVDLAAEFTSMQTVAGTRARTAPSRTPATRRESHR